MSAPSRAGATAAVAPRGGMMVWSAAIVVYVMAIAGRSSFGVAGLEALTHFGINAATLSMFTVIQVAVYACAQIPVGILVDRIGTRRVLAGGALIMAAGQILLGMADTLPMALAVRVLIGLGDATAYGSVLRLLPVWFPPRRVPVMTQLTGIVGGLGQVVSSLPFAFVLDHYGWKAAFVALGVGCGMAGIVAFVWVRDAPRAVQADSRARLNGHGERGVAAARSEVSEPLTFRQVLVEPGIWLGFFTHFSCGVMPNVFLLLWGSPFLQVVNGMSKTSAAAMLMIQPIAGIMIAPIIGRLTGSHPLRRTWLVYTSLAMGTLAWIPFLFGDPRPTWMVVALLIVIAVPSSCSAIGFDFVRTSIDVRRIGVGNGVVNMGGFTATLICSWVIGKILDLRAPSGHFTVADFHIAMSAQLVLVAIGTAGIIVSKRATRKKMARDGIIVPPLREVWSRYRPQGEDF